MVLCTIRHAHTYIPMYTCIGPNWLFWFVDFRFNKVAWFCIQYIPCVETNQVKNNAYFCIFLHMWQLRLGISSIYIVALQL